MQQWLRSSKFLLIFLPIWLFVLSWIRPLSVPDEGRYGDISRTMFESGDWLTPRIDSLPFMHKPPLLHWLSSMFMELLGVHVWVLRLVPVLAATLMLVSIFLFVKAYFRKCCTTYRYYFSHEPAFLVVANTLTMIYCSPLGSPLVFYVLLTSLFLRGNLFYF